VIGNNIRQYNSADVRIGIVREGGNVRECRSLTETFGAGIVKRYWSGLVPDGHVMRESWQAPVIVTQQGCNKKDVTRWCGELVT